MSSLLIGLDAGGTKTAALADNGGTVHRLNGPGAQAMRDGVEATVDTLADVVRQAQAACGDVAAQTVVVGLAGAGREEVRLAVESALSGALGGAFVRVTNDAEIAMEACFGGGSGAVLLVGTGSLVYARGHEGETHRAGGWGPILGDDSSGTAIGRAALRAVLAAFDGGPPTQLVQTLADMTGLSSADSILHAVYSEHRPLSSFASVALRAAEAEDWVATAILTREANALAQQAGWLATRVADSVEHRIAMCGGMTAAPVFRAAVEGALGRHLPGWEISLFTAEPVQGALALARRLNLAESLAAT